MNHISAPMLSLLLGLLAVGGFAPFSLFPLPVVVLAILFWQWQHTSGKWAVARLGFAFGLGLFGAGVGWIFVAMHDYGDMSFVAALLATTLFVAFYALFPALVAYLQTKLPAPTWVRWVLYMPALWVLLEWLRGLIFTGLPWLALGYSQAAASPLAGYAPLFGVYGVSLAVAVSAGLLANLYQARWSKSGRLALLALVLLWGAGAVLRTVEWTQVTGGPFQVSLVQGNIPQELKFREEKLVDTLETYRRLVLQSSARLIVLPETALPMLRHELPPTYLDILRSHARQNGADILFGAFEYDRGAYYNSVLTLGSSESQSYRKNHLVPFGEFIPLRPMLGWLINDVLNIPMSDLTSGGERQALLNVAGQQIAMAICYEDVFGEEVIRYLPQASVLVNVSNDAWYGHSHAAMQHNQIAQMRALESGRMMLRATNTGVTSIIGRDGAIQKILPQHEEGVLTGQAQGYSGSTPYVRWGNTAVLALIVLMLALTWKLRRAVPSPDGLRKGGGKAAGYPRRPPCGGEG